MSEFFTTVKEWITPVSALLIILVGVVDNSKKIAAKPLTKFLSWLGSKLNAEVLTRLDGQEAYLINEFYQKHSMGKRMTKEQYEGAIKMFEDHLIRGANTVNTEHLKELKEFYHNEFCRTK